MSGFVKRGAIVSLESTTWPGTTDEVLAPIFRAAGLEPGIDMHLVYSPEREDPGRENFNAENTPKIVGGYSSKCLEQGLLLYSKFIETVVPVSSAKAAELVKLVENIYRSVNIGLVNEIKTVTDRMNIDIFEIVKAAGTKPFGFTPFYPGPGVGGHCIPIDPFYLTWKAREYGLHTRFIELAGEINANMPDYVSNKVCLALNSLKLPMNGARILVLGISYKKNVDDCRKPFGPHYGKTKKELGCLVAYSDPYFSKFPEMKEHSFDLVSQELTLETLSKTDLVVVATDHDAFDYDFILEHAKLIVDTRGDIQSTIKDF